jgi:hypothetical protein
MPVRTRPAAVRVLERVARVLLPVVVVVWCALLVPPGLAAAASDAPVLSDIVIPNLGPGYSETSQGPLDPSRFASDSPDPSAAASALSTLATTISTYERAWQANGGLNQVQDLLVRFPSPQAAHVFLEAAQHSLESGKVVSKGPLASIPGARLVTYFAATNEDGVGEAITMGTGVYVALLSVFSAAAGNPRPITPSDAALVAASQYASMTAAPGGKEADHTAAPAAKSAAPAPAGKKGPSGAAIGLAVVAVAVLAVAVSTPLALRRRRQRAEELSGGGEASGSATTFSN